MSTISEPTVYELSVAHRCGITLPKSDVPEVEPPKELLRSDNGLPELSQPDIARHYLHLAQRNFGVETGFYPLGSCTMKYNPKINEYLVRLDEFANAHPLQNETHMQGNLAIMYSLQSWLQEIGGFTAVSLQPAAGAHGEFSALLMMRAYHADRGDRDRFQVFIPDSAHGTNPASTAMAGLDVLQIPSNKRGTVDLSALRAACDTSIVGIMLTNPNTLGLFEDQIEEITAVVHDCGGLVYGDGANMNALTGIVQPARLGIDLLHYNLHKTFATPHGGGGPGAGPLAASAELADYLPGPIVTTMESKDSLNTPHYELVMPNKSIGQMSAFYGNFGMIVRAYAYILLHGSEGLRQNAIHAVLNANYLRVKLREKYTVPYDRLNMHEFVCQGKFKDCVIRALDISKRLLDYGFHPPSNYFPLIVSEALMIEPTETESKQTLDTFVDAMLAIADEAVSNPEKILSAPHTMPVKRLDEVQAARRPILSESRIVDSYIKIN